MTASRDVCRRSTRARGQTTERRDLTAQGRLEIAAQRDAIADDRDLAALARDQAAEARDLTMGQLDAAFEHAAGSHAITGAAAEHRAMATQDRQIAARDREEAACERRQALADREAFARSLAMAATDELTGARTRGAGLADLEREIDRCRRTSELLVVVYVDVVGLKILNDTDGHAAGDGLLKLVVALIKDHVRSYDLVIRVGGDEFVCAISGVTIDDARSRLSDVVCALAGTPQRGAIRTGFAELKRHEAAAELIARADQQLMSAHDALSTRGDIGRQSKGAACP